MQIPACLWHIHTWSYNRMFYIVCAKSELKLNFLYFFFVFHHAKNIGLLSKSGGKWNNCLWSSKLMISVTNSLPHLGAVQSSSTRWFRCLISMQISNSCLVQCSYPAIHHYRHIFPKCHVYEGGGKKGQSLIYIWKGKKFFNQLRHDGVEQIKLKVIKASVLRSKLRP